MADDLTLQEPEWESTDKLVYLFEKKLSHNMLDVEKYHPDREKEMLHAFYYCDSTEKRLGLKNTEGGQICLLRQTEKEEFPIFFPLPEKEEIQDVLLYREADRLRYRWFSFLASLHNRELKETSMQMIRSVEKTHHALEHKNRKKEILKRMQKREKVFFDCYMEHYDFRELKDLSGSIFIHCHLSGADFSGCDLSQAVFVNCDLSSALFVDCDLNQTMIYNAEAEPLKDKTEWLRR